MNPEYARMMFFLAVVLKMAFLVWGAVGVLEGAMGYRQLVGLQKFYIWVGAAMAFVGAVWLAVTVTVLLFVSAYPRVAADVPQVVFHFIVFGGAAAILCGSCRLGMMMTTPQTEPASL